MNGSYAVNSSGFYSERQRQEYRSDPMVYGGGRSTVMTSVPEQQPRGQSEAGFATFEGRQHYQEIPASVPNLALHRIANESDLQKEWKKVARELKLLEDDISKIADKENDYERLHAAFLKWKSKKGHQATPIVLYDVLNELNFGLVRDNHFKTFRGTVILHESYYHESYGFQHATVTSGTRKFNSGNPIVPSEETDPLVAEDDVSGKNGPQGPNRADSNLSNDSLKQNFPIQVSDTHETEGKMLNAINTIGKPPESPSAAEVRAFLKEISTDFTENCDVKKIVIHLHNKGVISGDEMADVQRYQTCDANKVVYKAMCGDCGKGKLMLLAEALKEEASHTNNQRIAGHITDFLKQYEKPEECPEGRLEISKSEADTNLEEDVTSYLEELPSPSEDSKVHTVNSTQVTGATDFRSTTLGIPENNLAVTSPQSLCMNEIMRILGSIGRISLRHRGCAFFMQIQPSVVDSDEEEEEEDDDNVYMITCSEILYSQEEWRVLQDRDTSLLKRKICETCNKKICKLLLTSQTLKKLQNTTATASFQNLTVDSIFVVGHFVAIKSWFNKNILPLQVDDLASGNTSNGSTLAVVLAPSEGSHRNHFELQIGILRGSNEEELYYTMEGTPGSPIFLLKSKDAQSDLKGRYQLIGVHFSNPTEDCTWSSGKKLNKQLLHKFGI